jgi:voltage-gated potassium channel
MSLRVLLVSLLHSRVTLGIVLLVLVLAVGTAGFTFIEGWSLWDAVFMTMTTVTTVGYGEVHPLDTGGRIISIFVMVFGVGLTLYIFTALVAAIIEGDLTEVFGVRRMRVMIERTSDHYIVCGCGRVGLEVAHELTARRVPFVMIDNDEVALGAARAEGMLSIAGDATEESVLKAAGIDRCRALIAASGSDVSNTYITLTARSLRDDILIVARVSTDGLEGKLRQAGANRVISPYAIGGRRMALAAVQPIMTDFIDLFSDEDGSGRILAEFAVDDESGLAGRSLSETLEGCRDVVVVAVRDAAGRMRVGPPGSTVLSLGDRLTLVGDEDQLRSIGAFTAGRRGRFAPRT